MTIPETTLAISPHSWAAASTTSGDSSNGWYDIAELKDCRRNGCAKEVSMAFARSWRPWPWSGTTQPQAHPHASHALRARPMSRGGWTSAINAHRRELHQHNPIKDTASRTASQYYPEPTPLLSSTPLPQIFSPPVSRSTLIRAHLFAGVLPQIVQPNLSSPFLRVISPPNPSIASVFRISRSCCWVFEWMAKRGY
jgi:hypothetical protein